MTLQVFDFAKPEKALCFTVGIIDEDGVLAALSPGWRIYDGEILAPQWNSRKSRGVNLFLREPYLKKLYTVLDGMWVKLSAKYELGPLRSEMEATWNCRITDHIMDRLIKDN